jgi:hypothetical protein
MLGKFLFLLPLVFLAPHAWGDCGDLLPDEDVLEHVRQTKKVSPAGWKTDGFFYLFSLNGADVYLDLEYREGLSGEPLYTGAVYQVRGDEVTASQCFVEVDLGSYKFNVQAIRKTFTISGSSGCNDHSGDDCEPTTEKYHYVWNGLAFYTTSDIALSKSNLKKLLAAIRKKDQKAVAALIKQPVFYPALSKEDVDDREEETYFQLEKSKAATFAVMNFEVKETLKALKAREDPFPLFESFSEIANAVFSVYDSEGSQRKIFPEDRAYTQLINDIGFTYEQLWEQLLESKAHHAEAKYAEFPARAFENARAWLNSARNRDPQRAVVYLNLSDLMRVWKEKGIPNINDEPEAALKSQCYGSQYVELMAKNKLGDKVPPALTKFLGDRVHVASQPECRKFIL